MSSSVRKNSVRKKKKISTRVKKLPARNRVNKADCWDLSSLFPSDAAWEKAFKRWQKQIPEYTNFRGTLSKSGAALAACLDFDSRVERAAEKLEYYAFLKTAEDSTNNTYQNMLGRFRNAAQDAEELASYIRPELLAISSAKMKKLLASPAVRPWKLALARILRYKPHTLSQREERILAMQGEVNTASGQTFQQLHNSDMRFGLVTNEKGEKVELGHGNLGAFMESSKRSVRRKAYESYYDTFSQYEHTLASTLAGSIKTNVYKARVRGYGSALEAALFPDQVPVSLYENLIQTVSDHLPALHRYYALRAKALRIKTFNLYDQYVPLLPEIRMKHTWPQAVNVVLDSIAPLGPQYVKTLAGGLRGRWCDRYPNLGKTSGAFSAGSYDGDPYILMNFQENVLNDVFTLAHEAGHSMHSYYSAKHQPFSDYNYRIFVAEVASTFNEQLLSEHLLANCSNKKQRQLLIAREIDNIRGTIFRQVMFAEFERETHAMCEAGEPVLLESLQEIYRRLLVKYLGPQLDIDKYSNLECLRIPHFYRAFYVYKYATGMSAAIALAEKVTQGGRKELADYLNFLKSGQSKYPLELLQDAGVDMTVKAPIVAALSRFTKLVDQLDDML
ncbi:MAG: oligoendopeptidase F [Planctomycetaceae bacterium TMED10]|nr:MAG: oligoendopeptidase F [Planctomycetaceae bacterium TMED10]